MASLLMDSRTSTIISVFFLAFFLFPAVISFSAQKKGSQSERTVIVEPVKNDSVQRKSFPTDGEKGVRSLSNDPAPSAYMKVARPGEQALFVQDFIEKKRNFDAVIRKQQVYTKMLEDLKQEQQGIDELVRQEKRDLVKNQLMELNKKINAIKAYQASSR